MTGRKLNIITKLFIPALTYFRKKNGCSLINALCLFDQRLIKNQREDPQSIMTSLCPTHYLIGSTPEGTRLGNASEIDVTNKLEGLRAEYFELEKWGLLVTDKGREFFGKQV